MKYLKRLLIVLSILTVLCTVPVFAQEVTDPTKVIKETTFIANEDALAQEFHNSQIWRSENYVKYLDGVIYNLNETVRVKQEVVTNYKWLSQHNPYFATLVAAAEKDLANAQAWVNAYKEYKAAVQADLKVRYNY
jgi:hypothetical protein